MHATPGPLDRREDALDVDGAMTGGLPRVVHDELSEVGLAAQRVGDEDPHVDEMVEVAELIQTSEFLDRRDREGVVVRRAISSSRSGFSVASR